MAFFLKTYKVLRNNWKKSTFGLVLLSYGASSLKNRYDTNIFMRACCEEAMKYGEELIPSTATPRSITVILNPAANKRNAKTDYEKYCEPLFHLAGISVKLIQTTSEGHAKDIVEAIPDNEPVIVAGGDGTLSEAITGLLRKNEIECNNTIGVLPLGRRNYIGNQLFPVHENLAKVRQLADATLAIIKNESLVKDVMKIEVIETDQTPGKPIFAVGAIEWGAFRDALARRDKYWIYGGLREYATFLFNGYKNSLTWDCKGTIKYTPPCEGCSNCRETIVPKAKQFRWVDLLMPKEKDSKNTSKNFKNIINSDCLSLEEKCFKTTEVRLTIENKIVDEPHYLALTLGKMRLGYSEFVSEGWRRTNKEPPTVNEIIKARTIELIPENKPTKEGEELWYNIDNEEFDVKPIKITLLPKAIKIFCQSKTLDNKAI